MNAQIAEARQKIEAGSAFVVTTHKRPDGDAIASMLALYLAISEGGHPCTPVLFDRLPERFRFLPGADAIRHSLPAGDGVLIAVDCADIDRIGFPSEAGSSEVDINIDHHPTNQRFAEINLVDPLAASATELLYRIIPRLGLGLSKGAHTNLLAGLITDTIGFRTESVSPTTFRTAADLLEAGAKLDEIYRLALTRKDFLDIKYWANGLVRLSREPGIVSTYLTVEDRVEAGYPGSDDADLIDLLTRIDGIQIAIVFIEQDPTHVKVSFRSRGGVDVAELATQFNGGGHKPASGALIEGDLPTVMARVLTAAKQTLLAQQPM